MTLPTEDPGSVGHRRGDLWLCRTEFWGSGRSMPFLIYETQPPLGPGWGPDRPSMGVSTGSRMVLLHGQQLLTLEFVPVTAPFSLSS